MSDAVGVITGVGMTRFGKWTDRSVRDLASDAARAALDDAGVDARDVDLVVFGNAAGGITWGQEMIRGQVALLPLELGGPPVLNVENACASSSSALHVAEMAIRSGMAATVLVVGAEKLTHEDRGKTFAALAAGVDLQTLMDRRSSGRARDGDAPRVSSAEIAAELSGGGTKSTFMDAYARQAQAYMEVSGATAEDFAAVVVKSRRFGSLNEFAQFRTMTTVDEVLGGRVISDPLRLAMCSPIGDGAAALVVRAPDAAGAGPHVRLRASALQSGGGGASERVVTRALALAYEQAGVGPSDLDVAEVHDAAAPAELAAYEQLGICGRGDGPGLLRDGVTDLGGRIPVNPSGGLLSRGHPVGATGCAQIVELVLQLTGRAGERQVAGARIGLAQNAGGSIDNDTAAAVVTILEGVGR